MRGSKAKVLRKLVKRDMNCDRITADYDQEVNAVPFRSNQIDPNTGKAVILQKVTVVSTLKEGNARKIYKQMKKAA